MSTNCHDEIGEIRNELYVVEALLLSLTICGDNMFENCAEEGSVLADHAHRMVKEVIAKADQIVRAYDDEATKKAA